MNITIKIEAPDLCIAAYDLATAIQALVAAKNPNIELKKPYNPITEKLEPAVTTTTATIQDTTPNTAEQVSVTPPPTASPDTAGQQAPPTVTLETVRAKLAVLSQAGKQAQVKDLITRFGGKKLTEIPAEKYAELMAAAEAI